ncbi:glutathione S-transferase family protein [Chromobacterium haemolyticum]|uniref:Glutathione S-transferase family protein n=1 Tax=Chromobacterium fluminis TaxID=3044269 RepID=A0ABX0LFM2_9NEIS|nr:glutathione S-transferase family protein [Chromobacterium haemolyticum]NHR07200.1 glutathione S-transferase family protein [Chromobacterium haemolyticum]
MTTLTLYGNRLSGHSYKVRLALMLADVSHDYVHVDLAVPREQRPEDFRAASRFGEVPVLVADGTALCQSNAILQWLANNFGQLSGEHGSRETVREWLSWEANRVGLSVPNLRWSRLNRLPQPEVEAWLEQRARADLDTLDAALAEQPYLAGQRLSIADLSASAYLWWLADAGLDIAGWPRVEAWLERIAQQPGWQHPDVLMAPDIPD